MLWCMFYYRFPFWPYAKLAFNCWLVLPYFSGAAYVYQHYVRPLFVNQQTVNIWYIPRKKNIFSRADDVLSASEKFIEENGPGAFKKLINMVYHYTPSFFWMLKQEILNLGLQVDSVDLCWSKTNSIWSGLVWAWIIWMRLGSRWSYLIGILIGYRSHKTWSRSNLTSETDTSIYFSNSLGPSQT